jgi:hypothetical protein
MMKLIGSKHTGFKTRILQIILISTVFSHKKRVAPAQNFWKNEKCQNQKTHDKNLNLMRKTEA